MIITNNHNLPSSVLNALHRPTYTKGDDVAWCEARAAEAIPKARAAIKAVEGEQK